MDDLITRLLSLSSSLVAHWLSVPGGQGSNSGKEEKFAFLVFSRDLMMAVMLQINSGLCSVDT